MKKRILKEYSNKKCMIKQLILLKNQSICCMRTLNFNKVKLFYKLIYNFFLVNLTLIEIQS